MKLETIADPRVYPELEEGTHLTEAEEAEKSGKASYWGNPRNVQSHIFKLYFVIVVTTLFAILLLVLFLICIFLFHQNLALQASRRFSDEQSEPFFVTMIWRHGDRAPEKIFDGLNLNSISFPDGLGNLTVLGKLQAEILGEKIRRRYFSKNSSNKKVFIRSTKIWRTIQTAKTVANELRLPNITVTVNKELKEDTEGNPFYRCPRAQKLIVELNDNFLMNEKYKNLNLTLKPKPYKTWVLKDYYYELTYKNAAVSALAEAELQDIYTFLLKKANYKGPVYPIMDQIHCMNCHNIPTPTWTHNQTLLKTMKYLTWTDLTARFGFDTFQNKVLNKLTGGAILTGILRKLKNAVQCDRNKEEQNWDDCGIYFSGLSAHDITLAALFSTFPTYKKILGDLPYIEYGANVAFELRKLQSNKYGIKALYANSFRGEPVEITQYLPGCQESMTTCSFENFIDATKEVICENVWKECFVSDHNVRSKREVYFDGNLVDYFLD